ncbi:MAG: DedA family protein [Casimicrobiaceae bacterium]
MLRTSTFATVWCHAKARKRSMEGRGSLMSGGFEHTAVQFLHSYGYVALFVLLALETAMILHFVPSELIVSVAAATLATDGIQLALVIVVSTLGATAGSLALYAFARYGGRRFLDRHPRFFGLTEQRRARLDAWFRRPAGESLVFFFRMLPFLRAVVSIPAGLAEMGVAKFTLYSAAGSFVFNAVLAYSTYAVRANPDALAEIHRVVAYSISRWPFFLMLAGIALVGAYLLYRRRHAYRRAPHLAVRHVLGTSALAAMIAGLILLGLSLYAPSATYAVVTWVAVDAGRLAEQYNVSAPLFLVSIALSAISLGLFIVTVLPFLERVAKTVFKRLNKHETKGPR